MSKETIILLMDSVIRIVVLLTMPYLISLIKRYQLEKLVKKTVFAAEKMFNEGGMGKFKNVFVKEYILTKYKVNEADLDILIESRLAELDLLKKGLEVK